MRMIDATRPVDTEDWFTPVVWMRPKMPTALLTVPLRTYAGSAMADLRDKVTGMRDTPRGIVEELRELAAEEAGEIGQDVGAMTAGQAADYIEHLEAALERIRAGDPDPVGVARRALDPLAWLLATGSPG